MAYGEAWAPPATWGPWQELKGSSGGPVATYEVSFDTISDAPSSFSEQVEYVSPNGLQTEEAVGPGSITISSGGGFGTDRIRFKSHSLGQTIRYTY